MLKVKSAKINEITLESDYVKNHVFLTFDFDWAHDQVIEDTLEILIKYGAKATFLVTHQTPWIQHIRFNSNFELGIHPNLEPLAINENNYKSYVSSQFENLLGIIPEAVTFRSHATTNSSRILEIAKKFGIKYDLNYYIPFNSYCHIMPWKLWNGLFRVPFLWTDDVAAMNRDASFDANLSEILAWSGIKVFNFHPIHVYLNTESLARYEESRPFHFNPEALMDYRYSGFGTRDKLIALLERIT